MVNQIFYVITVPMVYLAVAWCLVGIAVKMARVVEGPRPPFHPQGVPGQGPPGAQRRCGGPSACPRFAVTTQPYGSFLILFHLGVVRAHPGPPGSHALVQHLPRRTRGNMIGNGAGREWWSPQPSSTSCCAASAPPLREVSVPADYLAAVPAVLPWPCPATSSPGPTPGVKTASS